jgi:hypothetical protein
VADLATSRVLRPCLVHRVLLDPPGWRTHVDTVNKSPATIGDCIEYSGNHLELAQMAASRTHCCNKSIVLVSYGFLQAV